MKRQKGFTLLELLIAVGLVGIVGYGLMQIIPRISKESGKMQKKLSNMQDFSVLEKHLLKVVTSGNIRFFSFNSKGEKLRSIYPMPERCGDLSNGPDCKEDTSLLYIKYSKTTASAVSTICRLTPSSGETNSDFIIDLSNETYGKGKIISEGVEVSGSSDPELFPNGTVLISQDKILSFFAPPFAYLYRVDSSPRKYSPRQDTNKEAFSANPEFSYDCFSKLQVTSTVGGIRRYNVNELYRMKVTPLFISELAGGAAAPDPAQNFLSVEEFPVRTFNVGLESFGRRKVNNKWVAGVSTCGLSFSNLSCSGSTLHSSQVLTRVRLDETFKISLIDTAGIVQDKNYQYEILSNNQTPSCLAGDPGCKLRTLIVNSINNIPQLIISTESSSNLISSGFSMIKQDELKSVRLRYQTDDKKEKSFEVFLP
jgi:prepilin-type N-terminal cleavage/methylation domain-containing protein